MILLGPKVGYHFIQVITLGRYNTYSIIHTRFPFFYCYRLTVRALVRGCLYPRAGGSSTEKKPLFACGPTSGTTLQVPPHHILVRKVFSMSKKGQQYTMMTDEVRLALVQYKKDHPGATQKELIKWLEDTHQLKVSQARCWAHSNGRRNCSPRPPPPTSAPSVKRQ